MKLANRAGMLCARYKEKGVWKKKSLEIADTVENREYALQVLLPKLKQDLSLGGKRTAQKALSFYLDIVLEEALEKKPATAKTYEYAARTIYSFFPKGTNVADIEVEDVDDFIKEMKRSGLKASTIQVYLAPLSLAMKEAKRVKAISQNPVEDAKIPTIRTEEKIPFSIEQIQLMIEKAEGSLKRYLVLAFYTGARVGEIISLRWCDYDGENINISRTKMLGDFNLPKSGKKRIIPVMRPLKLFLDSLRQDSELIVGYETCAKANYDLQKLQIKLGMAGKNNAKSTHYIRHTMASAMLAAKENPMLIKDMLGHVDFKMLNKTYGHYMKNENDFNGFYKIIGTKVG